MQKIYRNCDVLPIHNFYKVLQAKNYSYLYVDYDGYNQVSVSDDIEDIWEKIYEEYLKLVGDNSTILYYELVKDLLYLETRYKFVSVLLQQLSMGEMNDEMINMYSIELKKWRYNLDVTKPLKDELTRLIRQLKGSENKINLKQEEKKDFEDKNKGKEMSLIEQQVKLEQALSRNEIDTHKTVVSKWITMIKEVHSINKARKNNNGK